MIDEYKLDPLKVFGKEDYDEEFIELMRQNLAKKTVMKTWDHIHQMDNLSKRDK